MSVRKQYPSLCQLYFFHEDLPEDFLDSTDMVSWFYHDVFDISQSQHRNVRVSKSSNKISFAFKLFEFCELETQ